MAPHASRAEELQPLMHETLEYLGRGPSAGPKWEAYKIVLTTHSGEDLAHSLIEDLRLDRGGKYPNLERDHSARDLFQALALPAAPVCEELDKPLTPEAKASLIGLLLDCTQPEVVPAMLRQISDKRPAMQPAQGPIEHNLKAHALRVCDFAFNMIVHNSHNRTISDVYQFLRDNQKDRIIRENLWRLKLTVPE